ncbi:MAG: M23 family metallopeptidase [Caldilineales bacterium]
MGLLALSGFALSAVALAQGTELGKDAVQPRVYLPMLMSNPAALVGDFDVEHDGDSQPYVLRPGDDLSLLALDMGRDVGLMGCVTSSALQPLSDLRSGQTIYVPAAHFRCHWASEGQTVQDIARRYAVTVEAILETDWNRLDDADEPLAAGRRVLVPHAKPVEQSAPRTEAPEQLASSQPAVWPYGDGHFIWPVAGGVISQGFHSTHKAIDIAVPIGTAVRAVDNGVVVQSGYSTVGYGGRVIIDHKIDYTTLYAHLTQALVQEGDVVEKGQIIGYVGSTGNSTGPHLHFELRDFGYLIDPRPLLHDQ